MCTQCEAVAAKLFNGLPVLMQDNFWRVGLKCIYYGWQKPGVGGKYGWMLHLHKNLKSKAFSYLYCYFFFSFNCQQL